MHSLLDAVLRQSRAGAGLDGSAPTAVPGLSTTRLGARSALSHAVYRPHVCLTLQGAKLVAVGSKTAALRAGDSFLLAADAHAVSQVVRASAAKPFASLTFDLDLALLAEMASGAPGRQGSGPPMSIAPATFEVEEAALRLLLLADRPDALAALRGARSRELHYWLLGSQLGPALRRLGRPGGSAQHVARAVALLRSDYAKPLPTARLAAEARMSASSLHRHFRAATAMSPLQFQKRLRLVEARRLILVEGRVASQSAFAVGYESVSQFTREYRRMFGASPAKEQAMLLHQTGSRGLARRASAALASRHGDEAKRPIHGGTHDALSLALAVSGRIRVGLISDTHGLLRPEAVDFLRGCDRLLYAGDVCEGWVLQELACIAPVTAVRGNNDRGDWADNLLHEEIVEVGGIHVCLVHDIDTLSIDPAGAGVDVVVFGHSHKALVEQRGSVLYVNPGSAGPRRFNLPVTVAELIVEERRAEARVHFVKR